MTNQPEKVTLVFAVRIDINVDQFCERTTGKIPSIPKDGIVKYLETYFSRKFIEDRIMGYSFPGISATHIVANLVRTTITPKPTAGADG